MELKKEYREKLERAFQDLSSMSIRAPQPVNIEWKNMNVAVCGEIIPRLVNHWIVTFQLTLPDDAFEGHGT